MKRTDIERIEREQKRKNKKLNLQDKKVQSRDIEKNESHYINLIFSFFQYDEEEILNIKYSEKILETVLDMQENIEEKNWDNILKKSIKKTKIKKKEVALEDLKSLLM